MKAPMNRFARLVPAAVAALLAVTVASWGAPAGAAAPPDPSGGSGWVVDGPPGAGRTAPKATIGYDAVAGTVSIAVSRNGLAVLAPSPLGIVTEAGGPVEGPAGAGAVRPDRVRALHDDDRQAYRP